MTSNRENDSIENAPDEHPARPPRYTLRPVVKPLPSQVTRDAQATTPGSIAAAPMPRAENEDDDGYDPYSDIHDGTARALEFESDPWR